MRVPINRETWAECAIEESMTTIGISYKYNLIQLSELLHDMDIIHCRIDGDFVNVSMEKNNWWFTTWKGIDKSTKSITTSV